MLFASAVARLSTKQNVKAQAESIAYSALRRIQQLLCVHGREIPDAIL